MRIINFGSLNLDHVYRVNRFVKPGETMATTEYQQSVGGKGLNQSVALARAGAAVTHAGCIGHDGALLKSTLADNGVDVGSVYQVEAASGHAVIQVDDNGENCILLHGGANQCVTPDMIDEVLGRARPGDILLLQNEINGVAAMMARAAQQQLVIAFNPAPMSDEVLRYPLELVDYLIINQSEATALTGCEETPEILAYLRDRFSHCKIILTLGAEGVIYQDGQQQLAVAGETVDVVDTTAAGDTFIGYFLAELSRGSDPQSSLRVACRAAALAVGRRGAAESIPRRGELAAL